MNVYLKSIKSCETAFEQKASGSLWAFVNIDEETIKIDDMNESWWKLRLWLIVININEIRWELDKQLWDLTNIYENIKHDVLYKMF